MWSKSPLLCRVLLIAGGWASTCSGFYGYGGWRLLGGLLLWGALVGAMLACVLLLAEPIYRDARRRAEKQ